MNNDPSWDMARAKAALERKAMGMLSGFMISSNPQLWDSLLKGAKVQKDELKPLAEFFNRLHVLTGQIVKYLQDKDNSTP
jgi:hypothetical protein